MLDIPAPRLRYFSSLSEYLAPNANIPPLTEINEIQKLTQKENLWNHISTITSEKFLINLLEAVDSLTYLQNSPDGPSCFPDAQTCTLLRTSSLLEKLLPTSPQWPGNWHNLLNTMYFIHYQKELTIDTFCKTTPYSSLTKWVDHLIQLNQYPCTLSKWVNHVLSNTKYFITVKMNWNNNIVHLNYKIHRTAWTHLHFPLLFYLTWTASSYIFLAISSFLPDCSHDLIKYS